MARAIRQGRMGKLLTSEGHRPRFGNDADPPKLFRRGIPGFLHRKCEIDKALLFNELKKLLVFHSGEIKKFKAEIHDHR